MDNKRKEELITQLLVMMNNDIESQGFPINQFSFDFQEEGENMDAFLERSTLEIKEAKEIYNSCISRGYLKRTIAYKDYEVRLTEEGQGRAISSQLKKQKEPGQTNNFHIGSIQARDGNNIQIGHENSLIIETALKSLLKEIDESESSPQEKSVAKNKLKDFLNQPVITGILGAVAGSLISML